MLKSFCAVWLALAAASLAAGQGGRTQAPKVGAPEAAARPTAEKEVEELDRRLNEARMKNDAKSLEAILAPEWYGLLLDGVVTSRENAVASANNQLWDVETFNVGEVKVRLYGEVAVVTGRLDAKIVGQNAASVRYTNIFVRQKGKWQAVGTQYSAMRGYGQPPRRGAP